MRTISILLFTLCVAGLASATELYLSPSGNDSGNGTKESPLLSLNAAAKLIRSLPGDDTVFVNIAPGEYFMHEPLVLTPEDVRPTVFRGPENDLPVFYGGIEIKNWQPAENGVWKAPVPQLKQYGFYFEQLYVDGKRATRARTPDKGWMFVTGSSETILNRGSTRSPAHAAQTISVAPADLAEMKGLSAAEINDVVVMFYHKWDVTRKPVNHLDIGAGHIYTSGEGMKEWNRITKGSRYFIENHKNALNAPGEWFLDRNGDVYYIPLPGEDMTKARCFAPVSERFVTICGEPSNAVKNKTFRNISFSISAYKMPRFGNEPMQAAVGIDAALTADYAENIKFQNCEVNHTGGYAFWFRTECHNNEIDKCLLSDLGAGGIKIGSPNFKNDGRKVTSNNTVNNNIIKDAGHVFPCAIGVAIFHAADNKITHNDIFDLRYSGISVGWMWGYAQSQVWTTAIDPNGNSEYTKVLMTSPAVGNIVEYNHIHHIGWGELSDMGAVYTLGESPGTRICNNLIHDVYSYDYGGWGLYTDEGSTGIVMENNLVYGCKSGGFHQHYGKENVINNNIFAFGGHYQLQFTRVEKHKSFDFKHNIILADCGVMLSGPWDRAIIDMDYNCYWDYRMPDPEFLGKRFAEWSKAKDAHSIVADPRFINPAAGDFRFKDNEVIQKIGFKPFDYTKAGVYGSREWMNRASSTPEMVENFKNVIKSRENKFSVIYD